MASIDGKLDGGKAAVCIIAAPDEAAAVATKLTELGGTTESHEMAEEVTQEAETAAAEVPEAEAEEGAASPAEAPAEASVEDKSAEPASARVVVNAGAHAA